jgi:tetratricopeptide (TPR) repeat protein
MHTDIACVAAPRICPPGARAKVQTLFIDRPLALRPLICVFIALLLLSAWGYAQPDLLRQGIALMNASRPLEAEEVLKSVSESHPAYHSARILLGFLFLRRAALVEAEQSFRSVLDAEPENAPARLGLGMTYVNKGMARLAAREFERILGDPALGSKAHVQWIQSQFLMGKEEEAFREARELAARSPGIPEYQSILGFLYQVRGKTREAQQAFRRSAELEPGNLSTYMNLISIARNQQDWAQALTWTGRALRLDPNQPLLYQELATVYRHLGKMEDAETAQQEAERTYEAELLYIRATRSRTSGQKGEAEQLLRECVETNPRLSKAWEDLGELLRQTNRLEEARRAFQMALESDPESSRAYLGLAATLQSEGKEA